MRQDFNGQGEIMKWTERIGRRNAGKEKSVPWWVNDKFKLHKWAAENELPMPDLLRVWKTPSEMDLSGLPKRFVLKPSVMFSAWGVLLLEVMPDGKFWDSLRGRELTLEQVKSEQQEAYERCKYKGSYRLLVEERVESPFDEQQIPFDYKIHSFHGETPLVQQINRNTKPVRYAFFDGDFEPLNLELKIVSEWEKRPKDEPVRPECWKEMLEIAARVTEKLGTPFMRVDMFVSTHGPVIGELTPSPGDAFYKNNYTYTDEFDLELGQMWTQAESRIAAQNNAE